MPKTKQTEEEKELSSEELKTQLNARPSFSYDPNEDALYRHYAEQYQKNAKKAMEDTLGKASSLTGGYQNSYALTLGQQAYQSELAALDDILPTLYQMAYNRYEKEEEQDYERYQDALQEEHWQKEFDYNAERDKIEDERYEKEFALSKAGSAMDLTNENFYGWDQNDFVEYVIDLNKKYGIELTEAKIKKMQSDGIINEVTSELLLSEAKYGNENEGGKLSSFTPRDWTLYALSQAAENGYNELKKELDYYVDRNWLSRSWQTKILNIVKNQQN